MSLTLRDLDEVYQRVVEEARRQVTIVGMPMPVILDERLGDDEMYMVNPADWRVPEQRQREVQMAPARSMWVGYGSDAASSSVQATERSKPMEVSARAPRLEAVKVAELKECYKQLLEQGYARWPLPDGAWLVWVDGIARMVHRNDRWAISGAYLYIGYARAEGDGELQSEAARLAITAGLMASTGHSDVAELQALLSKAIARVLAGQMRQVVKPLAGLPDGRPLARIAWTSDGRVAAEVDGVWASPVTGEPVRVEGSEWVVTVTGEGSVAEVVPAVAPSLPGTESERRDRLAQWARRVHLATEEDAEMGLVIPWTGYGETRARECAEDARLAGLDVVVIERDGNWIVGWPPVEAGVTLQPELSFAEWVETTDLAEQVRGREPMFLILGEHLGREYISRAETAGVRGLYWEGGRVTQRPSEAAQATPPRHGGFEGWLRRYGWNYYVTADGRKLVHYGRDEQTVRDFLASFPQLEGCVVVRETESGNWCLTPGPCPGEVTRVESVGV